MVLQEVTQRKRRLTVILRHFSTTLCLIRVADAPALPSQLMVVLLQVLFVLALIVVVILLVFAPREKRPVVLPENAEEILIDYVPFYAALDADGQKQFTDRVQRFLSSVKITGAGAEVEALDLILIGAAAIIPVYFIPDWEYINLREVLLYPGHFNQDFDQHGQDRNVAGMVGNGGLEGVMILSKWELRQGFVHGNSNRNTAIHEFVHLVDKMDGTLDGVPEMLLERRWVPQWKALLEETMAAIRQGRSDIDPYGATSPVECFAVVAEYFFMQPDLFRNRHPQLAEMLQQIFVRK